VTLSATLRENGYRSRRETVRMDNSTKSKEIIFVASTTVYFCHAYKDYSVSKAYA